MFALFLEAIEPFYQIITVFPTLFFTTGLAICVLYWLVVLLGLIEIEFLDFDTTMVESDASTPEILTGVMMKWGLHGVPVTIVLSLIALFGWIACYYAVYFLTDFMPSGGLNNFTEGLVLLSALYLATRLTALSIWPIRPLFQQVTGQALPQLIGRTATVRSLKVNDHFGEAFLDNGGAGLILKIRSTGDDAFKKGDQVILLSYESDSHLYQVISEEEFIG